MCHITWHTRKKHSYYLDDSLSFICNILSDYDVDCIILLQSWKHAIVSLLLRNGGGVYVEEKTHNLMSGVSSNSLKVHEKAQVQLEKKSTSE